MLPWYNGIYTHAFVALHPFVSVEGLDPESCVHGTLVLSRSDAPADVDLIAWTDEAAENRAIGKELDREAVDLAVKRFGRQLGWRTLGDQAGFVDPCALDRALRTHIGGLRRELEDKAGAERLVRHCRAHKLFLPTEGQFQPVMQEDITELFRRVSIDPVWAGEEFGDDERLLPLSALTGQTPWADNDTMPRYGARRLFAPDRSLLAWVHWDSFFTVIFGTEERLRDANLGSLFEGFWCSEETRLYWLNQPCLPLVQ